MPNEIENVRESFFFVFVSFRADKTEINVFLLFASDAV